MTKIATVKIIKSLGKTSCDVYYLSCSDAKALNMVKILANGCNLKFSNTAHLNPTLKSIDTFNGETIDSGLKKLVAKLANHSMIEYKFETKHN